MFGFLSRPGLDLQIDLLRTDPIDGPAPAEVATRIAVRRFRDHLRHLRVAPDRLTGAQLTIKTGDRVVERLAGGLLRRGHEVTFAVDVTTVGGTIFHSSIARFVAPHDPAVEGQSWDSAADGRPA